jgi:hypothetical protein
MKMNKKLLVLGATFALTAPIGTNAMAEVVNGDVSAQIVTPLEVTEITPMNFGDVAGGATSGTIIMLTDGSRTATGGATILPGSGSPTQGIFNITGIADQAILVQVTDSTAILVGGGGADMPFTLTPPAVFPIALSPTGTATLNFGGNLSIGPSQTAGLYSTAADTYTIQVDYQ